MNKLLPFIAFLILLGCTSSAIRDSHNTEKSLNDLNAILYSAEDFFISIKKSDFETSWDLLSEKSKNKIIDEIYDVSRDNGAEIEKDDIRRSFRQKGLISSNFWNAARSKFDPDMVLEESHWEIGFINNSKAEITITYRKSSRPSNLKMYKESGSWRVGLVETFWSRKYLDSLFSFLRL
jgi:hypothetical protein